MRLRILRNLGKDWPKFFEGEVREVDDATAERLLNAKLAEITDDDLHVNPVIANEAKLEAERKVSALHSEQAAAKIEAATKADEAKKAQQRVSDLQNEQAAATRDQLTAKQLSAQEAARQKTEADKAKIDSHK
jgi:hypothetical protein